MPRGRWRAAALIPLLAFAACADARGRPTPLDVEAPPAPAVVIVPTDSVMDRARVMAAGFVVKVTATHLPKQIFLHFSARADTADLPFFTDRFPVNDSLLILEYTIRGYGDAVTAARGIVLRAFVPFSDPVIAESSFVRLR